MTTALADLVEARFERSGAVPTRFFERESARIAEACWAMARRFHQGGRLLALGAGSWASDAHHVAVEFVHPVIVGKRALPALAITGGRGFDRELAAIARPQDMALGISLDDDPDLLAALAWARDAGLLTLALTGAGADRLAAADLDFHFAVESGDAMLVQETHETLYHVLWELVHVFFEHEGLLDEAPQ